MSYSFLDFEKPISLLEKKIEDLRSSQDQPDVIQSQVDSLNKEIIKINMFRFLVSSLILASSNCEYIYIKSDAPLKGYYFKIRNEG